MNHTLDVFKIAEAFKSLKVTTIQKFKIPFNDLQALQARCTGFVERDDSIIFFQGNVVIDTYRVSHPIDWQLQDATA